ncbi:MAG: gfo/Idh/MocA family oxidoreductase [Alphaproteobacteria bacterium]|nr:gfo/Idh/MocA family oxidoreductase [Alphaproteobacteria bacterium]
MSTKESEPNILVIGLGSMGKRRVRNLQTLGVKDIAGYDPRPDRRAEAETRYNIATYDNFAAAKSGGSTAWVISTPPLTHLDYALDAVDQGIHFFTEADLPDERGNMLVEKLSKSNIVGAPSCTMRFFPGPQKIRQLIENEKFGRPLIFTYHSGQHVEDWHPWETPSEFYVSNAETGAAREIVPFELIWLIDIFGDIKTAHASFGRTGSLKEDIDDHYNVVIGFDGGVTGHLLVDSLSRPAVRHFRLICTGGIIEWNHDAGEIRWQEAGQESWQCESLDAKTIETGYIHPEEPYIAEMRCFLDGIRDIAPYPYSYYEDERLLRAFELAEQNTMATPA